MTSSLYKDHAPRTTDLRVLHDEHLRQRDLHELGSTEALESWERWFREAARQGKPLDALSSYSPIEAERFFDRVRYGVDGHAYWSGGKHFRVNTGRYKVPRRWWWEHLHGAVSQYDDVVAACGEKACINPAHCETGRDIRRRRFTDETMLAALQVFAMRHGHAPTGREWEQCGGSPDGRIYRLRFGSWAGALEKAGLTAMPGTKRVTHETAVEAIREAARVLGRSPTWDDFCLPEVRDHLKGRGLPTSINAVKAHIVGTGSWGDAVEAAGLARVVSTRRRATVEEAVAAIRCASEFVGHPVGASEFRTDRVRSHLRRRSHLTSSRTIRELLGQSWPEILAAADVT